METAAGEGSLRGVGRIAVIAAASGLVRVEFLAAASPRLAATGPGRARAMLSRALAELAAYPDGGPLDCPVDLSALTPFQRRILVELRQVPRGATIAYGALAARAGHPRSARAVGGACGANPVPLWIPCHRVLAAGGGIGGFSGALAIKRALLALERSP